MDTAQLGLELPPLPRTAGGAGVIEGWWRAVGAAGRLGAGTLWLAGGPGVTVDPACDPCVLCAAASTVAQGSRLGAVAAVPTGRVPAVLARELTAVDVVTRGRGALRLRWGRSFAETEALDALEHLAEAAQVCRSVFVEDHPVFEGRFVHVAGAVNRPPPLQPGGPPVLVDLPSAWFTPATVRNGATDGGRAFERLVATVDGVVVRGDVEGVEAVRRSLEDLAARAGGTGAPPPLVIEVPLGADPGASAARWRGVPFDGVILRVAGVRWDAPRDVDALVHTIEAAATRWLR